MEEVDLEYYARYVSAYIRERTGYPVTIVFDDPMAMRRHFVLLVQAYDIAFSYYNKKNN